MEGTVAVGKRLVGPPTLIDDLFESSGAPVRIYSNHTDYGQVAFLGAFGMEQKKKFQELQEP